MVWVIVFLASWVVFLLAVDFKNLKTNIWGGIVTLSLGSLVDWGGQKLELYKFYDVVIPWFGCSAFYKFGPLLTMGILFVQYIPQKRWPQAIHIFVFSTLYILQELIIILTGTARYIHWHILASYLIDLLTFISLTWFAITYLRAAPEASERLTP